MLAGEFYLATDPQLAAEDLRAQELLFRFKHDPPGC
jgi:Maltose acetyltransferase